MSSGGGFNTAGGWTVSVASLDPDDPVGTHESIHYWLNRTTSYGALLLVSSHLADQNRYERAAARSLRDLFRSTQEAAATYITTLVVRGLHHELPHHGRCRLAMAGLLNGAPSGYARLHAALAVARVCLQPVDLPDVTLGDGLPIGPGALRSSQRPDERFIVLRRLAPDLAELCHSAADRAGLGNNSEEMTASTLGTAGLGVHQREQWQAFAATMYAGLARVLEDAGCSTDDMDANQHVAARYLSAVDGLPIVARLPGANEASVWDAGRAIDVETLDPPGHRVGFRLTPPTLDDVSTYSAGEGDDAHLHVAIRPTSSYARVHWLGGRPPSSPVCLRRVMRSPGGLAIEHIDLANWPLTAVPGSGGGLNVVPTISESALGEPETRRWWPQLRSGAVLVSDLPVLDRIQQWSEGDGHLFRYCFTKVRTFGDGVIFFLFRFDLQDRAGPNLHVRPLSGKTAGIAQELFREVDPSGRWAWV